MKRIIIYILSIFSIVLIGCSEEQKESFYTKGFEVNEVKINNEKESIDISFKYYKSLNKPISYNQLIEEKIINSVPMSIVKIKNSNKLKKMLDEVWK